MFLLLLFMVNVSSVKLLAVIKYFLSPLSLRSMAVLSSRAQERPSREIRAQSARERAAKPREK